MPFIKHVKLEKICDSPEHNPPSMIVLGPGIHTWECPACGKHTIFTVPEVTL